MIWAHSKKRKTYEGYKECAVYGKCWSEYNPKSGSMANLNTMLEFPDASSRTPPKFPDASSRAPPKFSDASSRALPEIPLPHLVIPIFYLFCHFGKTTG